MDYLGSVDGCSGTVFVRGEYGGNDAGSGDGYGDFRGITSSYANSYGDPYRIGSTEPGVSYVFADGGSQGPNQGVSVYVRRGPIVAFLRGLVGR